jgi:hypothetical protein
MADPVRRPRRRVVREVEATRCVCTPDRLCLFHYGQLDPGRRTAARRQAGVHRQVVATSPTSTGGTDGRR